MPAQRKNKKKKKEMTGTDAIVKAVKDYNKPLTQAQRRKFLNMISTMNTNDVAELIFSHYGCREERRLLVSELLVRNLE